MSEPGVERALDDFLEGIGRLRQGVLYFDVASIPSGPARDHAAAHRSSCFIWAAALTEVFVTQCVTELVDEIDSKQLKHSELQPSLLSVVADSLFASLRDARGLKLRSRQIEVLERITSDDVAKLDSSIRLLDGRTIRPEHIETVWRVFGLPGAAIPSPLHRLSLTEVADLRNQLAHGVLDPTDTGRVKKADDLLKTLTRLEDLAVHIASAGLTYCDQQGYRR